MPSIISLKTDEPEERRREAEVIQADAEAAPLATLRPTVPSSSGRQLVALARYMSRTDVHTYAFSVAANVILSLFPFIVLLLTVCRQVFHSRAMESVVGEMMHGFLP